RGDRPGPGHADRDRPADARRDLGPGHPPGRPAPRPPALGAQADGPARARRARGRLRRARVRGRAVLEREEAGGDQRIELSLDIRYYGQTPYMNLVIDEVPRDRAAIDAIVERYGE